MSVHSAALSMHGATASTFLPNGAVASTFFLNGFPHVPEWYRCTLSSSEEMTLLFLKGTAAFVLVFQWCGYTLHSSTDRKNQLLSDHLSLFLSWCSCRSRFLLSSHSDGRHRRKGSSLSNLFPLFLNAKIFSFFPGAAATSLQRILSSSMVPLTLSIWKKSLTGLEKTRNLPHQSNMIRTLHSEPSLFSIPIRTEHLLFTYQNQLW